MAHLQYSTARLGAAPHAYYTVFIAVNPDEASRPEPMLLERALQARQSDIFDWAGNPLLLTLIAVQFARDRRLPENRASIYAFAIEDLQQQRGVTGGRRLSLEMLNDLLARLALAMTKAVTRATTTEDVAKYYLKREIESLSPDAPSLKVAQELLDRSGALDKDLDRYEWIHLSLREYLTAAAMARLSLQEIQDIVKRYCLSDQWEQVWQLLISIYDAENRAAEADHVIKMLINLEPVVIRSFKQHDPLHIALSVATRCHFSRLGRARSADIANHLQRRWRQLYRKAFRRQLVGNEAKAVYKWLYEAGVFNWIDNHVGAIMIDDIEAIPHPCELCRILVVPHCTQHS